MVYDPSETQALATDAAAVALALAALADVAAAVAEDAAAASEASIDVTWSSTHEATAFTSVVRVPIAATQALPFDAKSAPGLVLDGASGKDVIVGAVIMSNLPLR